MSRRRGPGANAALEEAVIEETGLPIERIPNNETEAWDAEIVGEVVSSTSVRLFGWIAAERETPVEIKTCHKWIRSRDSNGGRRRGRWIIDRDAHEVLVERDGIYLLAIVEEADVMAWALVPAGDLDPLLSWTPKKDKRDVIAQPRWAVVFDPDDFSGGEVA